MSVGSNTLDNAVVSADNSRNVRAVLAVVRENVGVFIRVVVRERNFIAVPHFRSGKTFRYFRSVEFGKQSLSAFVRLRKRRGGHNEIGLIEIGTIEHAVAHIETAVENRDGRPSARIRFAVFADGHVFGLVNTRIRVDFYFVFRNVGVDARSVISFGYRNRLYAVGLFDCRNIAVGRLNSETVKRGVVRIHDLVDEIFAL